MALNAAIVWEIRTTGNANNGGGFKAGATGTDYSQQDAAEDSGPDLVIDGTSAAKVTSASHNFVAADVGNILRITAGTDFTAGFYEIVSVASNAATLDRNCGTTGSTGGTWALGGAVASLADIALVGVNGNKAWIKAGTYSVGADILIEVTWVHHYIEGYTTTRGDGGTATLQASAAVNAIVKAHCGNGWIRNIYFDGNNTGVRGLDCNAYAANQMETVSNCRAFNCTTGGFTSETLHPNATIRFVRCKSYDNNIGWGPTSIGSFGICVFIGCEAHSNTSYGWRRSVGGTVFYKCVARANGNIGFDLSAPGAMTLIGCVSYGNTNQGFGADANNINAHCFINCISSGNSTYGFGIMSNQVGVAINCVTGGPANTSGEYDGSITRIGCISAGANTVFTDAANGDFSLNTTAGGGAACRAAGLIGAIAGGLTTGYEDIGVAQHADPAAQTLIIPRAHRFFA